MTDLNKELPLAAEPPPLRVDEGGAVRVGKRRVSLDLVVEQYENGMSPEDLVRAYDGPFVDDYFLCFATDANTWYEASFYAEGSQQFLKQLSTILECELVPKLVGSTDFDSNVMWPPSLAGVKMFSYKPVRPKRWLGRLLGSWSNTQWFSEEVLAELQGQGRTRRSS